MLEVTAVVAVVAVVVGVVGGLACWQPVPWKLMVPCGVALNGFVCVVGAYCHLSVVPLVVV